MTNPDKSRHREELSIALRNAGDVLVIGKTDQATAEAIGRTRQTVWGWRLYRPLFQSELNRRRNEVWGSATDKLRASFPTGSKCLGCHTPVNKESDTVSSRFFTATRVAVRQVAVLSTTGLSFFVGKRGANRPGETR